MMLDYLCWIRWSYVLYLFIVVVVALYLCLKWQLGYYARKGIKSLPYPVPFFGHSFKIIMMQEDFCDSIVRHYRAFPEEKYIGFTQIHRPSLQIRDLDLIKRVLIKDFDHFVNHHFTISEEQDSILGNQLFTLRDEKWHDMRATLTPAFTSSKMRNMYQFMVEMSEQFVDYFKTSMLEPDNKEKGFVEIEMKEYFSRFTTDVIASTAFGVKVNSLVDKNNDFFNTAMKMINYTPWVIFKLFFSLIFPRLWKLNIAVFDESVKNFFRKLVLGGIIMRQEKNIIRPDMIHILMEARNGSLKSQLGKNEFTDMAFAAVEESQIGRRTVNRNWSDDEIVAQAVVFLLAGFDGASTLLSFMAHELAVNREVQTKLQAEVDEMVTKNGSVTVGYDQLVGMKYMDMVVTETLRKWPPNPSTDRECSKPYELPPSSEGGKPYFMKPGEGITIPIYGFHHDPKYFPDPSKFDPERFSEENKHKIVPLTYMPFGLGPRNCIGNRFALLETKAVMFHLLANFDFVQTAKTQHPIKMKKTFQMLPENGFWIGLKPRGRI